MKNIEYPEAYEAAIRRNIISNASKTFFKNVPDACELISEMNEGADRGNEFMRSLQYSFSIYGKLTEGQCAAIRKSSIKLAQLKIKWAEEAAEKNTKLAYIGNVGDKKVVLTLTTKKVIRIQGAKFSYYDTGVSYLHIAEDANGNIVTYKGFGEFPAENETATIHCTIKAHTEYNGAKQTAIIRPKYVKESVNAV